MWRVYFINWVNKEIKTGTLGINSFDLLYNYKIQALRSKKQVTLETLETIEKT